tara:strand:- start:15 stop:212 length:198 start_codon:yes stop_codon:yes gene_type:complete
LALLFQPKTHTKTVLQKGKLENGGRMYFADSCKIESKGKNEKVMTLLFQLSSREIAVVAVLTLSE